MASLKQNAPVCNIDPELGAPLLQHYDGRDATEQIGQSRNALAFLGSIGMGKSMMSRLAVATTSLCKHVVRDVVMKDKTKTILALKMGLALVLAFLLVLLDACYALLGSQAVWAIITVIVVFESTIGAALKKGLNRGAATLLAGLLAIVVGELANVTGRGVAHPIVASVIVFIVGGVATFAKHWPSFKQYEYGLRILLISFSVILVAEYRQSDPLKTAIGRFLIISLGAVIGISINVFILPCWAGNDLHRVIGNSFFSVANSLEVCVNEYLQGTIRERFPSNAFMEKTMEDPIYKEYKSTLLSASKEESLAGFASWEPPHGRFKVVKYPWHLYVKVGLVLRHCTYSVVALHGCLQSGIQAPLEVRSLFDKEICAVGVECACVLRKLGKQIEDMQKGDPTLLLNSIQHAVDELQESLYYRSYLLVRDETGRPQDDEGNVAVSVVPEATMLGNAHSTGSELHTSDSLDLSNYFNFSKEQYLKRTHTWPLWLGDQLDLTKEPLSEHRIRVLKSASALSLGTFATLLMEVALRLDYVIQAVQELGELAGFTDSKKDECDTDLKIHVNGSC